MEKSTHSTNYNKTFKFNSNLVADGNKSTLFKSSIMVHDSESNLDNREALILNNFFSKKDDSNTNLSDQDNLSIHSTSNLNDLEEIYLNDTTALTKDKAINILKQLYFNNGSSLSLNPNKFLIYGSVAKFLHKCDGFENKFEFNDIDLATSHICAYAAREEFQKVLNALNLEFKLVGNTFCIYNNDGSSFKIQLVTIEDKIAFPRNLLESRNSTYFDTYDKIEYNNYIYPCVPIKSFTQKDSETSLPIYNNKKNMNINNFNDNIKVSDFGKN